MDTQKTILIAILLIAALGIIAANVFQPTGFTTLEQQDENTLTQEESWTIQQYSPIIKEINTGEQVSTETQQEMGNESPLDCPEIRQFYGKCIDDLNPFLKAKGEECYKQRQQAIKLGIDWRKACGGGGGGSGGGSGSGNNSSQGNNDSGTGENNGSGETGDTNSGTGNENNEPEQTYFGINESKLGLFLQKKAELAQQQCVGCTKTFEDVSSERLSKITPTINEKQTINYGEETRQKVESTLSETSTKKTAVLIQTESEEQLLQTAANIKELGGKINYATTIGNIISAELPEKNAYLLATTKEVTRITKDKQVNILLTETIPQTNTNEAWVQGYTGKGIKVAVIDTGVDKENPMLQGKITAEADFSGEGTPSDLQGHGTHIAGIIAGSTENGGTLNGIAKDALIINAKAMNQNGSGTISSIIEAIAYSLNPDNDNSTSDGARIINLSLGAIGDFTNSPLETTLMETEAMGVIVIASAGNCGTANPSFSCNGYTGLTYPGSSKYVLTIGSVNEQNQISGYSSRGFVEGYGTKPELVAPGENITSAGLGTGTSTKSGTSMSTATATGITALLLEKSPLSTPSEIKNALEKSATDLGIKGKDDLYGFGLIDADKALSEMDLANPKTIEFTNNPTEATIGTQDPLFEAKIRIYNNTGETARIRDYITEPWLHIAYPQEISMGSNSYLLLSADQNALGIGVHEAELLLAINDYTLSHIIKLNVVEGTTDYNSSQEFLIEMSRPVQVRAEGLNPDGEIGRGKTITLIAKYNNPDPFSSGTYFGSILLQKSSYSCDTAPQQYFQPQTLGKDVYFEYTIPQDAPTGSYNATAYSWETCTGQEYDGTCHSTGSYSCTAPPYTNYYTANSIFTVINGCTSGTCCNENYGTFYSTSRLCNQNTGTYYECRGPSTKGKDLYLVTNQQYCAGNNETCNGEIMPNEGTIYLDCDDDQICNAETRTCENDPITCYGDGDCGTDSYINEPYCSTPSQVSQEFKEYTCNNQGTIASYCTNTIETRDKITCNTGQTCTDGACIIEGTDQCSDTDVGKSWCDPQTSAVLTCYFDLSTYSNRLKAQNCGIGICTKQNESLAFCDTSQSRFSITIDKAPLGLPVYKRPGDKVTVNFRNNNQAPINTNLFLDENTFSTQEPNCATGEITLEPGNNYCHYTINFSARQRPYPITISTGTEWTQRTINLGYPQTIIVTDSEKLIDRYGGDTIALSKVNALMQTIYQRAFQEQGVVYDLAEYREEVGAPPFIRFADYKETLSKQTIKEVNDYHYNVTNFIKSKCPKEYCKHILIVGDDYVIPIFREEIVNNTGVSYIDSIDNKYRTTVFKDNKFIPTTNTVIADTNIIFQETDVIAIVTPDNPNAEMQNAINQIKQTLESKYERLRFLDITSSQVDCNPGPTNILYGKSAILIGTTENNNAITCLDWYFDPRESIFIMPNPLGQNLATQIFGTTLAKDAQIITIYTESDKPTKFVAKMIKYNMLDTPETDNIRFVDTTLDTVSWAGLIPWIDIVGDIAQSGRDCGRFANGIPYIDIDAGQGAWCALDTVVIALPVASAKHAKIIDKLLTLGENGRRFIGAHNIKGIEFLVNLWAKSSTKLDETLKLIKRYGDEVGDFFLRKSSKITDVIASKFNNVDELIQNLSPNAKKVFDESVIYSGNIQKGKAKEALVFSNLEEKTGAVLKKTETQAGRGVDFIIETGGQTQAVSIKSIESTNSTTIKNDIFSAVSGLYNSPSKTNNNIIYVQAYENNYYEVETIIKQILGGDYGDNLLKKSDEYKIILSKIPDYLKGGI